MNDETHKLQIKTKMWFHFWNGVQVHWAMSCVATSRISIKLFYYSLGFVLVNPIFHCCHSFDHASSHQLSTDYYPLFVLLRHFHNVANRFTPNATKRLWLNCVFFGESIILYAKNIIFALPLCTHTISGYWAGGIAFSLASLNLYCFFSAVNWSVVQWSIDQLEE